MQLTWSFALTAVTDGAIPDEGQELITFPSGQTSESSFNSWSTIYGHSSDVSTASPIHNGRGTSSDASSSQDRTEPKFPTRIFQNGSSMFQEYECSNNTFSYFPLKLQFYK